MRSRRVIEQDPFLVIGEVAETDDRAPAGRHGRRGARLITGQTVEGRLRYVGSRADPATRTFTVELEVPNPDGRFVAGASAELQHRARARSLAHRLSPGLLDARTTTDELGIKTVDDQDLVVFHPARVVRAAGGCGLARRPARAAAA